ncbi:MAG: hypothetical protein PHX18_06440 [Candidatus Gastranaerophilales bacterium]|nr:hypothetical protein [Candidatus Gastranaerophilales bacterium]
MNINKVQQSNQNFGKLYMNDNLTKYPLNTINKLVKALNNKEIKKICKEEDVYLRKSDNGLNIKIVRDGSITFKTVDIQNKSVRDIINSFKTC